MKLILNLIFIIGFSITICFASETKIEFSSKEKQTTLIELFTSQGCSSCPPTERWLNKFTKDEKLWDEFVPVAFHVDYWNYLGWTDPYSSKEATQRQYRYRAEGNIRSVYTPAIVVNGQEYRKNFNPTSKVNVGILKASIVGDSVSVSYSRLVDYLELQVVILGFGIETEIKSGENSNKKLAQEFVVLNHKSYSSKESKWSFQLPNLNFLTVKKYGIAIWINHKNSQTPIQATGSWL